MSADDAAKSRAQNQRVAFISGNFNVIHAGHLRILKFAAEAAGSVVVGINPDGYPGVNVPLELRTEALQSISFVSEVISLPHGPLQAIRALRPDIVVKGKEFENAENDESAAVEEYGGRLVFGSGEMRISSLDIIERNFARPAHHTIQKPHGYAERHGFNLKDLRAIVEGFSKLRVVVVGDLIVDEYITCEPLGMSQEDPTIVVTPVSTKTFLGGAGIVAAHARGLGARVQFIGVAGRDAPARFARQHLINYGVNAQIITDPSRPTTLKSRFRANNKTLLRVNELRQHAIGRELQDTIFTKVKNLLKNTDLLLFSDFNYGCLPQPLVNRIAAAAERNGVTMAADSQASSQMADISRFQNMSLITPTEREARLALFDSESGVAAVASRLRTKARSKGTIITMGAEGIIVVADQNGEEQLDQLPAFNTIPTDVAGAGDSLFACASLSVASGHSIWHSAYLGSIAAAIQVSRVGNTPIERNEIIAELQSRSS